MIEQDRKGCDDHGNAGAVNARGISEPKLACSKTDQIRDKQQRNRNCERNKNDDGPQKSSSFKQFEKERSDKQPCSKNSADGKYEPVKYLQPRRGGFSEMTNYLKRKSD